MRSTSFLALWLLLALLVAPYAQAVVHIWNFDISEDQVLNSGVGDGSTDSPAIGRGHIKYDSVTDVLFYSISWSGLQDDLTALHIHGAADAAASNPNHLVEIFNTSQDVIDAGLDLRSDVVEGSIASFDDGLTCDAGGALACFLEDRAYVNVHSQAFPMGEIRGNLLLRPKYVFFDAVSTEGQVANNAGSPDGSTDSPGIGYGHFRWDMENDVVDFTITWSGLLDDLTKLHIHGPADPGSSNPNHLYEIFDSVQEVQAAGVDPRNDSFSGSIAIDPSATTCDDTSLVPCLLDGRAYINVHTQAFPMGEIRGDLQPRPRVVVWDFPSGEEQVKNNAALPDGSTDSPGAGRSNFRYDADREMLAYTISWQGLLDDLTKLHIHGAASPDQSNPNHLLEIFNSAGDVAAAGVDPIDGSHSGTFVVDGTALDCESDDALVCMIEERGYVNVHTEAFGMGEIRGNLRRVPHPYRWLFGASEQQVKNNAGNPDGSTDSPALGFGELTYDENGDSLAYTFGWRGLLGDLTKLHIHGPASPSQNNANHLFEIFNSKQEVIDAGLDPAGDETHSGSIPVGTAAQACDVDTPLACFFEQLAYVNVHTEAFPMGEIRGNLRLAPEPAPALLVIASLAAISALRARSNTRSRVRNSA